MPYVLPQVLVFQEFSTALGVVARPLRAHIAGGNAQLVRFADPDQRETGSLGYYDPLVDRAYLWPGRPAGAIIDPSYTAVWLSDALLRYFETSVGGGYDVTRSAGANNRVHAAGLNFKTNGDFPRSPVFLDRDVRPGDIVKVRGLDDDGDPQTTWTYVRELLPELTSPLIEPAEPDTANAASQTANTTSVKVSGVLNGVIISAVNGTAYNGLPSGYITETYDLLVTEPSVAGDLSVARLRVISGSGTDDQATITPAIKGTPFAVGTRGLTVTFNDDDLASSSQSAADAGIPVDELLYGHRWRVTVRQAFTPPTAASGGTYSGPLTTIYIAVVSKGGAFASSPELSVSTTDGSDVSGPHKVTASAAAVAIGSYGVTIALTGTALRKGDKYYIAVSTAGEGPLRTLVLGANLNPGILSGTELDLTLYIRRPALNVPEPRQNLAPLVNWSQTPTELILYAGLTALDPSWTDAGVQIPLDVVSEPTQRYGRLYAEYRAWLSTVCGDVYGISDVGDLDNAIPGSLTPDNPLKWGVFKALSNSNGVEVKYSAVCDPTDIEEWADMLGRLVGRDDVYGLVPLTRDQAVLDLYAAHVNSQSAPETALWRVCYFSLLGVSDVPIVSAGSDVPGYIEPTTSDGEACLCIVEDDPNTSDTQYTIVRCTSGNSLFLTNRVRPGDRVRVNYYGDGFGNITYSEYLVDVITSEDELRLLSGPAAPITVGAKTEVWRTLTATEESNQLASTAGAYADRRVRAVWPDSLESGGVIQEGFHLCAVLAGLASGVLPHQGLTHFAVAGFTALPRTTVKFNRSQLDVMSGSGTWVVTQSPDGSIFSRHAVTTADYDDINAREEMITRNVDSISYRFKEHFAPFIGVTNVTPIIITRIGTEVENLTGLLQVEAATDNLGGQLISADIVELAAHATLKDRIVLRLSLEVPYALNNIEVHLTI